ncbi:MAG: hypothetical protein ABJU19_26880 [Roseobacter sp.]
MTRDGNRTLSLLWLTLKDAPENLTLASKAAKLVIVGVTHSVVVNGATVCAAGRVGTYLSALGAALSAGADLRDLA